MSAEEPRPSPVVALFSNASARRDDEFEPFWRDAVAADPRLAVLRDNDDWRGEIEGRLIVWRSATEAPGWHGEMTKPEVDAIGDRVRRLGDDVVALWNDASALTHVARGGPLDDAATRLLIALAAVADAVGPAMEAAEDLSAVPSKGGGRGAFTAALRPKPADEFGDAAAAIFRRAGLLLGGNANPDVAFERFMEVAAAFATGGELAGMSLLLARLRKG